MTTAVMRRSALARSGNAPTARGRRLISPCNRSRPLVERIFFQCCLGKAKYRMAAAKPFLRHSSASGSCLAQRASSSASCSLASLRLAALKSFESSLARRYDQKWSATFAEHVHPRKPFLLSRTSTFAVNAIMKCSWLQTFPTTGMILRDGPRHSTIAPTRSAMHGANFRAVYFDKDWRESQTPFVPNKRLDASVQWSLEKTEETPCH